MAYYECRIKEYRQLKELTQRQLARQVGIHLDTIGRLERARREPSLRVALAISRVLDTPVEEMFIFR